MKWTLMIFLAMEAVCLYLHVRRLRSSISELTNSEEVDLASKLVFRNISTLTDTCRAIAWSKWGSIASISSNGLALELRNLRCHPENGIWGLSEPTITPPLTSTMDGGPLKHLCWSPTGSELAVIDAAGRVTILAIFSSLNKPTLSRHCQADPADDLHSVV